MVAVLRTSQTTSQSDDAEEIISSSSDALESQVSSFKPQVSSLKSQISTLLSDSETEPESGFELLCFFFLLKVSPSEQTPMLVHLSFAIAC